MTIARAREIRITFILFPWAIPFALDWFRFHAPELKERLAHPGDWALAAAIIAGVCGLGLLWHLAAPDVMRSYLADFKNGYWLVLGAAHISATLALFWPRRLALARAANA